MTIRIPWRVRLAAYRLYQHGKCLLSRRAGQPQRGSISFYCGYHQGTTGATVAIASIANHLAPSFPTDAFIRPQSGYSRLLNLQVKQTFDPQRLQGKVVVVDIEQESATLEQLLADGRQVLITCHALPTELHGVPQPKLIRNLELASHIHFVSEFQRQAFIDHYPQIDIAGKSFFIPNYTRQSEKHNSTGSVGVIGYLSRPQKNGLQAIRLGQRSSALSVECWGSDEVAGLSNPAEFPKLKLNGWSDSTREMHASFDVLISASRFETFGLVVSEALSAGIPCLLSDIPVFRSLYEGCPGVEFITGDEVRDVTTLNRLLAEAATLKAPIIAFWEQHFSNETVRAAWLQRMETVIGVTPNSKR